MVGHGIQTTVTWTLDSFIQSLLIINMHLRARASRIGSRQWNELVDALVADTLLSIVEGRRHKWQSTGPLWCNTT